MKKKAMKKKTAAQPSHVFIALDEDRNPVGVYSTEAAAIRAADALTDGGDASYSGNMPLKIPFNKPIKKNKSGKRGFVNWYAEDGYCVNRTAIPPMKIQEGEQCYFDFSLPRMMFLGFRDDLSSGSYLAGFQVIFGESDWYSAEECQKCIEALKPIWPRHHSVQDEAGKNIVAEIVSEL